MRAEEPAAPAIQIRLKRKRDQEDEPLRQAWWESEDGRFLVYRTTGIERGLQNQSWREAGAYWEVSSWNKEHRQLLRRHGLKQRFATRREALARLQDALQLEREQEEAGDE